jgi:hypothetical protein
MRQQHSPHLWLLKEGLLMTHSVAHFSALGVSNFVNTSVRACVCVCVCVRARVLFFHLSFYFPLVNSDFQSFDFS